MGTPRGDPNVPYPWFLAKRRPPSGWVGVRGDVCGSQIPGVASREGLLCEEIWVVAFRGVEDEEDEDGDADGEREGFEAVVAVIVGLRHGARKEVRVSARRGNLGNHWLGVNLARR